MIALVASNTFLITMVIMGLSTVLVGLLPTYSQVGVWAPILLVTMRLAQGLAVGREYGGAAAYITEHAPSGRRGYAASWLQMTATIAFLCAGRARGHGWRLPTLSLTPSKFGTAPPQCGALSFLNARALVHQSVSTGI